MKYCSNASHLEQQQYNDLPLFWFLISDFILSFFVLSFLYLQPSSLLYNYVLLL